MKSQILKEKREAIHKKMQAVIELAKGAEAMTEEQRTSYSELETKYDALTADIELHQRAEQREAQAAAAAAGAATQKHSKEEKKAKKSFSFMRAINLLVDGKPLDGLELEMSQEAAREARESGHTIEGFGIPSMLKEKRALSVGTDTEGGHTVAEEMQALIPALEPRLQMESLGATILDGLVGNIAFPRTSTKGSATWEGEIDAAAAAGTAFDQVTMTPKRLAAKTLFSKQLLRQSSLSVENFVRMDLERATRIAVDAAAINGSGAGGQPTGILNQVGIGDVSLGATVGGPPTHAGLVALETAVAVDDADLNTLAYLTTPGVRGFLKTLKIDAGSGQFVWGQDSKELNGYRAAVSTQVPSTLVEGGSGAILHAILYGDFSSLILGQWGPLDILVDPYSLADTGQVRIVTNTFWDIALRHAESFAASVDADIS